MIKRTKSFISISNPKTSSFTTVKSNWVILVYVSLWKKTKRSLNSPHKALGHIGINLQSALKWVLYLQWFLQKLMCGVLEWFVLNFCLEYVRSVTMYH